MIIRVLTRIVSRAFGFAVDGAVCMAFVGALEGAIIGALLGAASNMGGPGPSGMLKSSWLGCEFGGIIAAGVGAATGAIAFAVAGGLTAKRKEQESDLAFFAGLAQAVRGSLWGVLLGASTGVSTAILFALLFDRTPARGLDDYAFGGYIVGVIGGFVIGTFVGALCGAFGKTLPRNGREFIQSVKRLGGLGKAS